jgi:hypothetical protein
MGWYTLETRFLFSSLPLAMIVFNLSSWGHLYMKHHKIDDAANTDNEDH